MKINEELFHEIALQVESDMQCGGLTGTMYEEFAKSILGDYLKQAYQFDAWQAGYDDTMFDGIDTSSEMPCQCASCQRLYNDGKETAFEEINKANKPA
jgi:hypothetical protein